MKARVCATLLGVLIVGLSLTAWADSIETWSGMLFEGTIIAGVPEILTMDDGGVTVSIRKTAILDIAFNEGEETARVTTTTGQGFEDRILTAIGTVTIRTSSGDTEVANTQIRQIRFPYKQTENPTYNTTAALLDGRYYEGNLTSSFPSTIAVEAGGVTSNVRVDRIITIAFGMLDRIETAERVYEGKILSGLPETVRLSTKFGELAILRTSIDRITFSQDATTSATVSSGISSTGFGIGAKVLGQIPLAFARFRLGTIAVEAGVGMSAGTLVYDVIGRYQLTLIQSILSLYAGGGLLGVPGGGAGVEVLAGAEFSLVGIVDVPLSFFGGIDWLSFGGFSFQGWHVGLRWDF